MIDFKVKQICSCIPLSAFVPSAKSDARTDNFSGNGRIGGIYLTPLAEYSDYLAGLAGLAVLAVLAVLVNLVGLGGWVPG